MGERPMRTDEVAEFLQISRKQVLRLVHNGRLPATRIGRLYYFDPMKIRMTAGMADAKDERRFR